MLKTIITMFEEILDRDSGTVQAIDEFREYDDWDSLAYLSVIAKIDDDFDIVISREQFGSLKTVGDLAEYLEKCRS